MAENDEASGRAWLRARVENDVWRYFDEGEIPIEFAFADFHAPGIIAVTNKRVLFAGKALILRQRVCVSIPLTMIERCSTELDGGGVRLGIETRERHFSFAEIEPALVERLRDAVSNAALSKPMGSEVVISADGVPRALLVAIVLAGVGVLWWSRLIGAAIVFVAAVIYFADAARIDRIRGH